MRPPGGPHRRAALLRTAALVLLVAVPAIVALVAWPSRGTADVFVPDRDELIVDTVPASSAIRGLNRLRTALARDPQNLPLALQVARRYIELARADGDPRYLGYAQSALAPWWAGAQPEVALLRATIRQSGHEFDAALADLNLVIAARPGDTQALFTRATIEQVTGRYADAVQSCIAMQAARRDLLSHACLADARSMTGDKTGYEPLRDMLATDHTLDLATRGWLNTLLAEMLERQGRPDEAARHYALAMTQMPGLYTRAAYADFLLVRGQPEEALAAASPGQSQQGAQGVQTPDVLLLRQVLALQALGRTQPLRAALAELQQRFEAAHARGASLHGREEARLILATGGDPRRALELAQQNWRLQKEPADTLVLAQAAVRAGRPDALAAVRAFVDRTGFSDRRLADLLASSSAAASVRMPAADARVEPAP